MKKSFVILIALLLMTPNCLADMAIPVGGSGIDYVVPGNIIIQHTNGTITSYKTATDTNTARGSILRTAMAAMVSGENIYTGPGIYALTATQLQTPNDINWFGHNTIVTTEYRNTSYNSILFGTNESHSGIKFKWAGEPNKVFQLVGGIANSTHISRGNEYWGGYDNLYFINANQIWEAVDDKYCATYDNTQAATGGASITARFRHCDFLYYWTADSNFGAAYGSSFSNSTGHNVTYIDCNFAGCGRTDGGTAIMMGGIYLGAANSTAKVFNCRFQKANQNAFYFDIYTSSTSTVTTGYNIGSDTNGHLILSGTGTYTRQTAPIIDAINNQNNTFITNNTFTGDINITTLAKRGLILGTTPVPLVSGTVTAANLKLSLVNGAAFVDFNTASVLTDYAGKYIVITNSSGYSVGGWIKEAGSGETYDSNLLSNGTFDNTTTGWTASAGSISSTTDGYDGNCLSITKTGSPATNYAYASISTSTGALYKYGAYVKSGTAGDKAFYIGIGEEYLNSDISGTSSSTWTLYSSYKAATATSEYATLLRNTITSGSMLFDDAFVRKVLTPSVMGVTIVSNNAGTTYNWKGKDSSFNLASTSDYTYNIYDYEPGVACFGGSVVLGKITSDRVIINSGMTGETPANITDPCEYLIVDVNKSGVIKKRYIKMYGD
jgi:hypothetical protein